MNFMNKKEILKMEKNNLQSSEFNLMNDANGINKRMQELEEV
jgi:hypothetical protein